MKPNTLRTIFFVLIIYIAFVTSCRECNNEDCTENYCSNHGICVDEGKKIHCECEKGYEGEYCKTCSSNYFNDKQSNCLSANECNKELCSGNGVCRIKNYSTVCICNDLFQGLNCDSCISGFHLNEDNCIANKSCEEQNCGTHGTCNEENGYGECICQTGYTGDSCEECLEGYHLVNTDECIESISCTLLNCGDYGECIEQELGHGICKCSKGYKGEKCNECDEGFYLHRFTYKCEELCQFDNTVKIKCENSCIDPRFDVNHCGECGNNCQSDEMCFYGKCLVSSENCTNCLDENALCCENGRCLTEEVAASHVFNCGGCATDCSNDEICVNGKCYSGDLDKGCNDCESGDKVCCLDNLTNENKCLGYEDFTTTIENCGGCNLNCIGDEQCKNGYCYCPSSTNFAEYIKCDGICTNIRDNPEHCGSCNNKCEIANCNSGVCLTSDAECEMECGENEICCMDNTLDQGKCLYIVNLLFNDEHCGNCGFACPENTTCNNGLCECEQGVFYCNEESGCVDIETNNKHCGRCGVECGVNQICTKGTCYNDDENCGSGGLGWCKDNFSANSVCCDGSCKNLADMRFDNNNCGGCGLVCEEGLCINSQCRNDEISDCYNLCDEVTEKTLECYYQNNYSQTVIDNFKIDNKSIAFKLDSVEKFNYEKVKTAAGPKAKLRISKSTNTILIIDILLQKIRNLKSTIKGIKYELPVYITPFGTRAVLTKDLVVRFKPNFNNKISILQNNNLKIKKVLFGKNRYLVKVNGEPSDTLKISNKLNKLSSVVYAQPDYLRIYKLRNSDPYYYKQWHLSSTEQQGALLGADISAEEAWQLSKGKPEVIIAICDNGVDIEHPDLKDSIINGLNVPDNINQSIQNGCCWHGTAVAGVAAAKGYNNVGVRGVCPSCSIMPVNNESIGSYNITADSEIAELFTWPADNGAAVMNNSWGPDGGDPSITDNIPLDPYNEDLPEIVEEALLYAEQNGRNGKGMVIVFAAGNSNVEFEYDKFASHPLTLSVSASGDQNLKADYSSFGSKIDVCAPSQGGITSGIFTTDVRGSSGLNDQYFPLDEEPDKNYTSTFGGTSSSAPVVAGVAALIISANSELTAAEVRQIIRNTTDKIDLIQGRYDSNGHSPYYGYGKVNAYKAVRAAMNKADNCIPFDSEICNGVDDDCDNEIDEGCDVLENCATCSFHYECSSKICTKTPDDISEKCIQPCGENNTCPLGYYCFNEHCIPTDNKCSECENDETCNGVDDDCDGETDEDSVCSNNYPCRYNAECRTNQVCFAGNCNTKCSDDLDCEDYEKCMEATLKYGEPDGTRICSNSQASCSDYICYPDYDSDYVEYLSSCLNNYGNNCEEFLNCVGY